MLKRTKQLIDEAYKQGRKDGYEDGHAMGYGSGKEKARADARAETEQARLYEYNKGFKDGSIVASISKIEKVINIEK